MDIKFRNFDREYHFYHHFFQSAVKKVHSNQQYILGKYVSLFEKKFAHYCGVRYCVGVGSGFSALYLILRAYIEMGRLKKGDKVLLPAHTFIATFSAIIENQLIPVPVDINYDNFLMNHKAILPVDTKAMIWVHLYGYLCDMSEIERWAKENKLLLIEDSAQCHGAHYRGRKSGSFGEATAFSFYPTKNLGTWGDGGAVITNDKNLYELIRCLRNYGKKNKTEIEYCGINSRLDELLAAILIEKLQFLDVHNKKRQQIAYQYLEKIKNNKIILPQKPPINTQHAWYLFVIKTKYRDDLHNFLAEEKIQTEIHYPIPAHKQKCFQAHNFDNYPVSEEITKEILSIPLHPFLKPKEVNFIIKIINTF